MTSQTRVTFHLLFPVFALAMLCALTVIATRPAQAQTFTVLHTFSGGVDGGQPVTGLTMDRAGNLYGTTSAGGPGGYGTVFKMTHRASGWELSTLYGFHGGADGGMPETRVIFGPDGTLYGTTNEGGGSPAMATPRAAVSSTICGRRQPPARPLSATGRRT